MVKLPRSNTNQSPAVPNGEPTYDKEQNIGKSRHRGALEDRVEVKPVITAGKLTLVVGMVADGIGGGSYGERAAQLAIDTTFKVIEDSPASSPAEIASLLQEALVKANEAVFGEARQVKQVHGMGSTAVVVAIHDNKLYLANVGDSRAYLVRGGKVQQLTRDHNWADEVTRAGKLKREAALKHPKAEELVRSIGYEPEMKVDLGFYFSGEEPEDKAAEHQGYQLHVGDRIVVCSDGLVKQRHDGNGHYVEPEEIHQIVTQNRPLEAAQKLVQQALDRGTDDNVSVVVLETAGSAKAFNSPIKGKYIVAGVVGLIVVAVLVAGLISASGNGTAGAADSTVTTASTTQSATAGPVTAQPTPAPGMMAVFAAGPGATILVNGEGAGTQELVAGDQVRAEVGAIITAGEEVLELGFSDGSQLYLEAGTELILETLAGEDGAAETRFRLNRGRLLAQAPAVTRLLITSRVGGEASTVGGLMGVFYQEDGQLVFSLDCFEGACRLEDYGGELELAAGEYSFIDNSGAPAETAAVRQELYYPLAPVRLDPPTETPTPAATPTPTLTPSLTPSNTPRPVTPTPTHTLTPTFTPTPAIIDSDGDGVSDESDGCDDEPGPPSSGGCPPPPPPPLDSDGDGKPDSEDPCPFEAGTVNTNWCAPPPS